MTCADCGRSGPCCLAFAKHETPAHSIEWGRAEPPLPTDPQSYRGPSRAHSSAGSSPALPSSKATA